METQSIIDSIYSFCESLDRAYHFPVGSGKTYPLLTQDELSVARELTAIPQASSSELEQIRKSIDHKTGYKLTILALRMALLAFRSADVEALSRAAVPLLIAAHAIDRRDLLRALALYSDGCRRSDADPHELLRNYRSLAEDSTWNSVEQFFGRSFNDQQPEVVCSSDAPFDSPNSFLYLNL
jgi:hypothetical protein